MSPRPQFSTTEVDARRAAILEAALDQIAAQGPESVRMKDIAEAAGLSVGHPAVLFRIPRVTARPRLLDPQQRNRRRHRGSHTEGLHRGSHQETGDSVGDAAGESAGRAEDR
ncbi:helix-turn-helix domain-containing protein [Brevibacterium sp. FME37]|uniref:helix-turn-helix domain-containing protein n=1 Tax=Brevibacterium sp. FME37 TaxID=2742607 RepID=UPI0021F80B90|nr:helix-turn-helix domain-containing protein [Brevibacterium sp. FME37]